MSDITEEEEAALPLPANWYKLITSDGRVVYKSRVSSVESEEHPFVIQLAAYSYDNGVAPYTGENPDLLRVFKTLVVPEVEFRLRMVMAVDGQTMFSLIDPITGTVMEQQIVQHKQTCPDNYFEGTVNGLYFGGTCVAPEDVWVTYSSAP